MTTSTREVHTGWATHNELPDTFLVYAECPDERTEMMLMKPPDFLRSAYLIPKDEVGTSEAYLRLLVDHQDRCASCRAWATSGRTIRKKRP